LHIESGLEFSLVFRGHSFAVIVDDEPMAKRFAGTGTHVHPKKIARQSLRPQPNHCADLCRRTWRRLHSKGGPDTKVAGNKNKCTLAATANGTLSIPLTARCTQTRPAVTAGRRGIGRR